MSDDPVLVTPRFNRDGSNYGQYGQDTHQNGGSQYTGDRRGYEYGGPETSRGYHGPPMQPPQQIYPGGSNGYGNVSPQSLVPPGLQPPKSMAEGILTNLYENKLIVICIVFVIIILGIIAYVFLKKEDEFVSTGPQQGQNQNQNQQQNQQQGQQQNQQQGQQQNQQQGQQQGQQQNQQQQTTGGQGQPSRKKTKEEFQKLLEQSKNAVAATTYQNQQVVVNEKTEDEILQLMEDEAEVEEVEEKTQTQCSHIIPPNKPCTNTALSSGKCAKHGGK